MDSWSEYERVRGERSSRERESWVPVLASGFWVMNGYRVLCMGIRTVGWTRWWQAAGGCWLELESESASINSWARSRQLMACQVATPVCCPLGILS